MKATKLKENMTRFRTKNLVKEGTGDLMWLNDNKDKITQLLDPATTPEEKIRIGKEIKADGEKENMWGKTYTALERLEGAASSVTSLAGLIKPFIPKNPAPLNLSVAQNLLKAILGNVNMSVILNALGKIARKLGVAVTK